MNRLIRTLLFLTALTGTAGASSVPRNLILVHGAHLDAASWRPLLGALGNVPVRAVQLPGRRDSLDPHAVTLELSARKLCQEIAATKGEITLLAHSQGGAVVNHSLGLCQNRKVRSIIYLAAVAPFSGEKPFDLLSKTDEQNYLQGVAFDQAAGLFKIVSREKFLQSFSPDATQAERDYIFAGAVAEPSRIGEGVVQFPRHTFDHLEKFYILTTQDQIITAQSQLRILQRLRLSGIYRLVSGHLPMVTAPRELSRIIHEIMARQGLRR